MAWNCSVVCYPKNQSGTAWLISVVEITMSRGYSASRRNLKTASIDALDINWCLW